MQIKDNAELSNILSMAFAAYANKVQNGLTAPFKDFLVKDSIDMTVSLSAGGSISMAPIVPVVESIAPAVIEETPVLEDKVVEESIEEIVVEKPKRKRKV